MRHALERIGLEPFRRADEHGVGRQRRRDRARDGADPVRGHREDDQLSRPASAA